MTRHLALYGGDEGRRPVPNSRGPFSRAVAHRPLQRAKRARLRVALVSMPFGSVQYPNIQIGLLKAILGQQGFRADTLHLNLELAARIGANTFEQLATFRGPLFGDWLFSREAFTEDADPDDALPDAYPELARTLFEGDEDARERLRRLRREEVPPFLDSLLTSVPWDEYDVVGFTSTFQQTVASIALARRLKARFPRLVTVFGGANFDGVMGIELVRSTPWIDYAVSGEGDATLPALLDALLDGRAVTEVPGLLVRAGGEVIATPARPLFDGLAGNPAPDYDEYFERAERLALLDDPARRLVDLPFESSRGCWWGQKHHCTFCGLNGQSMAYRVKPIERVVGELAEIAKRYRSFRFIAVDNIINHEYIDQIAERLSQKVSGADLFYEIKANLTRAQIQHLGSAGITRIQPGIESLSTPVLKLMRKGITAIQNINTLKWAHYYGLRVSWNVLWGFPGEREVDYQAQTGLVRNLVHIPPPSTWGRIWVERFSPLFFDAEQFPRRSAVPHGSYGYVYPPGFDLSRVAYFFEAELEGTLPDTCYVGLGAELAAWAARWKADDKPSLRYWWATGELVIEDTRRADAAGSYVFEGALADAYHFAGDKPRALGEVAAHVGVDPRALEAGLESLAEAGLLVREQDKILALALPARPSLGQTVHR